MTDEVFTWKNHLVWFVKLFFSYGISTQPNLLKSPFLTSLHGMEILL